jgi:hypothetical protein
MGDMLLWLLRKGDEVLSARVLDNGRHGCELQVFRNGEKIIGRRFDARDPALEAAEGVRAMYVSAGWTDT